MIDTPLLEEELVSRAERISRGVREHRSDRYDGMTESGPGIFFALTVGRDPESLADHYDEMDPMPWADGEMADLYLDPADPDVYRWVAKIDRYTDGAILVGGDGRIHPYTVHLDPPEKREEGYEEGWGTKTRTALDISATDLGPLPPTELDYLREFPEAYEGHVDSVIDGGVWADRSGAYGDVVAVTVSSKNGQINIFDRGEIRDEVDPVRPSRGLDDIWEQLRDEINASTEEPDASTASLSDQYTVDDPNTRRRIDDLVRSPALTSLLESDGAPAAASVDASEPVAED